MTILVNGEQQRIGLALSGGGFRAAAFHLGVFRKLESMGILWKIDLLTCVSGGSIAGAFLTANWGKADTLDRLQNYLMSKSIAVSSVIGGVLDPFHNRLDKLSSSYAKDLYKDLKLNQLVNGPRLYLNTTNLSSGNLFFFVTGGGKPAEMGEHQLGVVKADDFPLCKAVAASSAFPPVFPPLRIDSNNYSLADGKYTTLTDGGVYDNLGVNPLLRERNDLDYAIVSDGGKPFENNERPTKSGTAVLFKSIGILMEQVRGLQFKRLELAHQSGKGPKPLWFSIDSHIGEAQPGDANFSSSIGTNLKKLSKEEVAVLTRHAAALLNHRMETYASELLSAS